MKISQLLTVAGLFGTLIMNTHAQLQVETQNGTVEGIENSGIRIFRGIPFAQPPVGELRWKAPQPPLDWEGVLKADKFGAMAMQNKIFGDMGFRATGMSEDCLYLNVWAPEGAEPGSLPVLVYFYGGGFQAGDGSEDRYNGESMAHRGIVSVTVNYRLNIFGFLAHPLLTAESEHSASGNYGLLDQNAALKWVAANIEAFGGDPERVTIAGESAGSMSVSAQMASPLSKDLINQAIGESGSFWSSFGTMPHAQAEQIGTAFFEGLGATTLENMRAIPAEELLAALMKPGAPWFSPTVDGYFFPESPIKVFKEGKQADIPLLAGWNNQEMDARFLLGPQELTVTNYEAVVKQRFPEYADEILKAYQAASDVDVETVARDLAADTWIAFSTWKWLDAHADTTEQPVYRYYYCRARPAMRPEFGNAQSGLAGGIVDGDDKTPPAPPAKGAVHSAEIEYCMGNLERNKVFDWTPDDYRVSATMQAYFANFIKTGNPNYYTLPEWPQMRADSTVDQFMQIDVQSQSVKDTHADRHAVLEKVFGNLE